MGDGAKEKCGSDGGDGGRGEVGVPFSPLKTHRRGADGRRGEVAHGGRARGDGGGHQRAVWEQRKITKGALVPLPVWAPLQT